MIEVENICSACGACCNGLLYGYVALDDDEVERVRHHLPVVEREPGLVVAPQPCSAHNGSACTIYDHRPKPCARYRCDLLKRVEQGEVAPDKALRQVSQIRRLADELSEVLGPGKPTDNIWNRAFAQMNTVSAARDTAEWNRQNAALLMIVGPLKKMCRDILDHKLHEPEEPSS